MLDSIVVCLVMVVLFATSLIFMDVAIQIIDKMFRSGEKDQPDYDYVSPADFEKRGDL